MQLNSKLQLATFFISMVMLSACGGGGGDSAPRSVTPAVTPEVTLPVVTTPASSQSLEGSWSTACQASKSLKGYDEQVIFNFKGNKLTTDKFFYVRDNNAPQTCKHSEQALRERINADISLGEMVNPGTNTRHTKINIIRTKVMLAPMNSTLTALLNNAGHTSVQSIYNGYGINTWNTFHWEDLSSIEAAKTNFKIAESVLDIFQIAEAQIDGTTHKVLKLGDHGGNVDSDARPIALVGSITATLQKKTTSVQTAQAAGLIRQWNYPCRKPNEYSNSWQRKVVVFTGNQRITLIEFFPQADSNCASGNLKFFVRLAADIVLGKVINKGAANEHTQIGIKTTKVGIWLSYSHYPNDDGDSHGAKFYSTPLANLYDGYGQVDLPNNNVWKDIISIPGAMENFNLGTQTPDIFKISTVTGGGKVLKMGDYKGSFDINGRAMSLEPESGT